jgi:catechol 2,3-dioxygenase-like lactoylglutathione lyase family enzyme
MTNIDSMPAAPRIEGVHHSAFRCRDPEETRAFYEDTLGLPLAAALPFDVIPSTGERCPYMHLFFEMGDGNYIAFFHVPERNDPALFQPKWGFDLHQAFVVKDEAAFDAFRARLAAREVALVGPIDHEFVRSVYFYDPNGLLLEITYRTARHEAVMREERAGARRLVAEWSARHRPAAKAAE